ncbi:MAG: hypothetical protein PHY92_06940 [Alphaproteobacteria bacterium]|nr:hypothetical protein [Alphaproteobacteria bacterium]
MKRLKNALEQLDEMISSLEDRIGLDTSSRREAQKKQDEVLKQSRAREAQALAVTQKVAARLDKTIQHVETVLRG